MKTSGVVWLGLVLFFFGNLALGGGANGVGGGHVVVCRDAVGGIKSIELLDFYEAHQLWSIDYDLSQAKTYQEKVELALSRLKAIDPARAARYESQFQTFEQDALRESGITLVNVPDTGNLAFPTNCKVEQMITQSIPQVPEDHRYLIDQDMWSSPAFDEDNKAGIILHELIYREAIEDGQTDSRSSRYFNAYLTANKIASMSQKDYLALLQRVGLTSYMVSGWLDLGDLSQLDGQAIQYYPTGQIQTVSQMGAKGQITVANQKIECEVPTDNEPVEFYQNGVLQNGVCGAAGHTLRFEWGKQVVAGASDPNDGEGYTYFAFYQYQSGSIQSLSGIFTAKVNVQGMQVSVDPHQEGQNYQPSLNFYPDGALEEAFITDSVVLKTSNGSSQAFANQNVSFDESGLATKWDAPRS